MKITRVDHFRLDMPLAAPYTIAYETISSCTNIILRVETDAGITGWGCAAPDKAVTGETPEEVVGFARGIIREMLTGRSPFCLARVMEDLKGKIPFASSARAMVDMALYDIMARKAGIPLFRLLGGYRESIPTSITIGILPLEETLEQVGRHLKDGFFIIKLKGGIDPEADAEKILKMRERFGRKFTLRFDANQGYNYEQSVAFMTQVRTADLEIIEQPVSKKADDRLGRVTRSVDIPVMADESIMTLKDAFRLASNGHIDMINIKLMKMGGIFESLHINSVAKAAGMEVMVGCMDESALGIAAGLHFALSRSNIEYADLDGHLDLLNDPFSDLFKISNGILYPSDEPGLGPVHL